MKEELAQAMEKLRKMVASYPAGTPAICHDVTYAFLDVCAGYQQWVNELKEMLVALDTDNRRMRSTIESQSRMLQRAAAAKEAAPKIVMPE